MESAAADNAEECTVGRQVQTAGLKASPRMCRLGLPRAQDRRFHRILPCEGVSFAADIALFR